MGWIWTAGLNAGLGVAAYLVSRHGFRQPAGWPRALAAAVLGWGWLTVGMEALGGLGLLARGPLLAWVAIGLLTGIGCRFARRRRPEPVPERTAAAGWAWEEVVSGGMVLWASVLAGSRSLFYPVKVMTDGPIYHLYFAARWWKSGRLDLIASPFGENAAPYFPAVGDLWFSWLMIGWGGDRLARVGQVPFLVLCGLSAYALCRRLGAGRTASAVAVAWFVACTPFFIFSFEANVDTIMVAGYLLAAYFFARYALGDDGPSALALGALAAGCAMATKAPGVVFVPPLLALGAGLAVWQGRGVVGKLAGVSLVVVVPFTVAGFWWGRNWARTGNPLYPLHLVAFGRVWLEGWYGPGVMRSSPYYVPAGDWRSGIDIFMMMIDPRLAPVWLAALAGAWSVGSKVRGPVGLWVWVASALAVLNVALFWVLVPYRTQYRFVSHALGLAAVPLSRTLDRGRLVRRAGVGLLVLHMLTRPGWPFDAERPPWDLSPLVPNNLAPPIPNLPTTPGEFRALRASPLAVVPTVLIGLASMATVLACARAAGNPTPGARAKGVVSAVGLVGVTLAVLYPWRLDDRQAFYPPFPDYHRGWLELDLRSGPGGARVAYAGTDLPYFLMGAGLRNEVRYVNLDAHRDWLLHDYHRDAGAGAPQPATWPDTRPAWDRLHPDYDAWLANLRAEGIQLLVVTRTKSGERPGTVADVHGFPIERAWAEEHPEAFEPVYGDRLFRIYRVTPPSAGENLSGNRTDRVAGPH